MPTYQALEEALPVSSYGFRGCLTEDGEHENVRGAAVVAKLVASALLLGLTGGETSGSDDVHIYLPSPDDDGGSSPDDSLFGGTLLGS